MKGIGVPTGKARRQKLLSQGTLGRPNRVQVQKIAAPRSSLLSDALDRR